MGKNTSNTAEIVRGIVLPVCAEMGLSLWDVTFEKEGADFFLRVLIEREDPPLDMNTCESFSRRIDPLLDAADPIEQSYFLEVGSPGLGRRLRTPEHFARYIGAQVTVRLIRPDSAGRREMTGTLQAFENGLVTLAGENPVRLADSAYVRLCDEL